MKKFLLLLAFATSMFAFSIDYDGFEADFVQTVKNKSGKKIEYYGKLKAKKPDKNAYGNCVLICSIRSHPLAVAETIVVSDIGEQ